MLVSPLPRDVQQGGHPSRFHHPHLLEAGGLGGGGGVDAEEGGGGHAHPEVGGGPPGLGGGGQGQAVAHPTTDLALKHR